MPVKKKTNFISYEIDKLNQYLSQLQGYLDSNPPDRMTDRVEILSSTRGNPIMKVIASKEDQLKAFLLTLEKLPKILLELNELRKTVEGAETKASARGGVERPDFMDYEDYKNEEPDIPPMANALPAPSLQDLQSGGGTQFDDDGFWGADEDIL